MAQSFSRLRAAEMVNCTRYPLDDLTGPRGTAFAADSRRRFEETGLCMLQDFLRPEALEVLAAEANGLADRAYFCASTHNAYLTPDDESLPADHPGRRQEATYVGSVAYDLIPEDAALRNLYMWDPLRDACLPVPVFTRQMLRDGIIE